MFKYTVLIALAIAGASAQVVLNNGEVAGPPEPYAYRYETDSHAAAEEKDPSGKVTGYYTMVDVDGRQRRVDYIADELGFRARVATNEVGTKSENSADVEVLAAPPTDAQLAQQAPQARQIAAPQRNAIVATVAPSAALRGSVAYGYNGLYNGLAYNDGAYYSNGLYNRYNGLYANGLYNNGLYANGLYANGLYNNGLYNNGLYANGLYANGAYNGLLNTAGSYNYHTPGSYFSRVSHNGVAPAGRYLTGYQTVGVPAGIATTRLQTATSTVAPLAGSQNYLVLKKRA